MICTCIYVSVYVYIYISKSSGYWPCLLCNLLPSLHRSIGTLYHTVSLSSPSPFTKKEKVRSHKLVVQGPMSEYVCLLIWTMLRQWIRVTIDETSGLLQISAFQRKMRRSALALKFCRSLWKFHEWDISFAHEVNRRLIVSVKTEF